MRKLGSFFNRHRLARYLDGNSKRGIEVKEHDEPGGRWAPEFKEHVWQVQKEENRRVQVVESSQVRAIS